MTLHVTRYKPELPQWPYDLPLRIAVLTDLHACQPWTGPAQLAAFCQEANALGADIILLLGDYVSGPRFSRPMDAAHWAARLGALSAPLGVHAILGNHDYDGYRRADLAQGPIEAERALTAAGIPVYVNRAIRVDHAGRGFWLAGLGDQFAFAPKRDRRFDRADGIADLDGTLAQVTSTEPVLLMAHEPDIFPDVPGRVALTLSGHTHGGQVRLFGKTPVVPSRYGSRYVYGHIVEADRHLIVSSGLGYSGWPIRYGTKSEIVVIDLGKDRPI
ncbi:Metallophosphoesterase [Devosia sp. LC5]|uniref:metallophosphoesterase n=1 Tax=Devosia sp. LC5 TaxID=1502724 RepID=UPI0004E325D8|nr:metallophosphoesterase [Devosia sp. LC5]KFC67741.1 Metallophosphoesterase [Devosia sp. LC5]